MAQPLTNIGTTVPPVKGPATALRFLPRALPIGDIGGRFRREGRPEAIPVARHEDEGQGEQYIQPDPLWISRWQPSATPPNRPRPWVTGYRWWVAGAAYQSLGRIDYYRLDMRFIDQHQHYYKVEEQVWREFRVLTTSVGQWLHYRILKGGAAYEDGAF